MRVYGSQSKPNITLSPSSMLKLQKFRKRYGSYSALSIGDIEIPSGIFWIKGANGSGMSTFLSNRNGINRTMTGGKLLY